MNKIESRLFERSRVAAHEIGHALVFAVVTGFPSAVMTRSSPSENGWCRYSKCRATRYQFALAATGGFVGEAMFTFRLLGLPENTDAIMKEWRFSHPLVKPSDTDLQSIAKTWRTRERHVNECFKIIKKHRSCFDFATGVLMQSRNLSVIRISEIFNAFGIETRSVKEAKLTWKNIVDRELALAMGKLRAGVEKQLAANH